MTSSSRTKKPRADSRNTRRSIDTADLRSFLDTLAVGVNPSIHINGHTFSTALVCVDFGSPIVQARLTPEQTHELNDRLRAVARDIIGGREAIIRINHDGPNGVYWASMI